MGGATAGALRFGVHEAAPALPVAGLRMPFPVLVLLMAPLWLALLGGCGAYDRSRLGAGAEEYRAVLRAAVLFLALVATTAYLARDDIARGFVLIALPVTTVGSLLVRHVARRRLHRRRARGELLDDVLVIGTPDRVVGLARQFRAVPSAGFRVVGAVVPDPDVVIDLDGEIVPVLGAPGDIDEAVARSAAGAVAVADADALPPGGWRRLARRLDGSDIDLVVAPGLTDIAGPRLAIRPVAGLPLLYVEKPQFSRSAHRVEEEAGRVLAAAGLIVLSPLLLAVGLAVRLTSRGPALFHQTRVGRNGELFTLHKFRTMHDGAEADLPLLLDLNEHDGLLFKLRRDPRVTRLGRILRRFSIDELPQLWNVVRGEMGLVGPRPPLPCEAAGYDDDLHRRLLVKPGMTGLWQVSGRADLPWEEAVRLDLYYVENWSLSLDLVILLRTAASVLTRRGAY